MCTMTLYITMYVYLLLQLSPNSPLPQIQAITPSTSTHFTFMKDLHKRYTDNIYYILVLRTFYSVLKWRASSHVTIFFNGKRTCSRSQQLWVFVTVDNYVTNQYSQWKSDFDKVSYLRLLTLVYSLLTAHLDLCDYHVTMTHVFLIIQWVERLNEEGFYLLL